MDTTDNRGLEGKLDCTIQDTGQVTEERHPTSNYTDYEKPSSNKPIHVRVAQIKDLMARGIVMPDAIARELDLKENTIRHIAQEERIPHPPWPIKYSQNPIPKPSIDAHLDEGLTQTELGEFQINPETGKPLTKEAIRLYLTASGNMERWKQGRERKKLATRQEGRELVIARKQCIVGLVRYILDRAEGESWAVQQALRYDLQRGRYPTNVPLQKIILLFETYATAQQEGRKLSFEELAQGAGISYGAGARRILLTAGCTSLYGPTPAKYHVRFSPEQRATIKKMHATRYSAHDIAYFAGISTPAARYWLRKSGKRGKLEPYACRLNNYPNGRMYMTYRQASQIYQDSDNGKSIDSIARRRKVPDVLVSYAAQHRNEIEEDIKGLLRLLYPYETIEHPYRVRSGFGNHEPAREGSPATA